MTIWLDAHLSPRTAVWMASEFGFAAKPLREIGLRDAEDYEIFQAAKEAGAVLLTIKSATKFTSSVKKKRINPAAISA